MTNKNDYNIDAVRSFVSMNSCPSGIIGYRAQKWVGIVFIVLLMIILVCTSFDEQEGSSDSYILGIIFMIFILGSILLEKKFVTKMRTDYNDYILSAFISGTVYMPAALILLFSMFYLFGGVLATLCAILCYLLSSVLSVVAAKKSIHHALSTGKDTYIVQRFIKNFDNEARRAEIILSVSIICKIIGFKGLYIGIAIAGLYNISSVALWEQIRFAKEYNCEELLPQEPDA